MVNLKSLEVFYWIVELGGFRKAAEHLHTTQPAISARIAQLEAELQVQLLDRSRGQTRPTTKGRELMVYARRLFDLHSQMMADVTDTRVARGTIRIGAADVIAYTWLPKLISEISTTYPLVSLEISVDTSQTLHTQLLAKALDIALISGPVIDPQIENVSLGTYELAWVASPSLGLPRDQQLTLADLAQWPLITFSRDTNAYLGLTELLASSGVHASRVYTAGSMVSIVRLVLDRVGVGVLPPEALKTEFAEGTLVRLDIVNATLPLTPFTASFRRGANTTVLASIADMASELDMRRSTQ